MTSMMWLQWVVSIWLRRPREYWAPQNMQGHKYGPAKMKFSSMLCLYNIKLGKQVSYVSRLVCHPSASGHKLKLITTVVTQCMPFATLCLGDIHHPLMLLPSQLYYDRTFLCHHVIFPLVCFHSLSIMFSLFFCIFCHLGPSALFRLWSYMSCDTVQSCRWLQTFQPE